MPKKQKKTSGKHQNNTHKNGATNVVKKRKGIYGRISEWIDKSNTKVEKVIKLIGSIAAFIAAPPAAIILVVTNWQKIAEMFIPYTYFVVEQQTITDALSLEDAEGLKFDCPLATLERDDDILRFKVTNKGKERDSVKVFVTFLHDGCYIGGIKPIRINLAKMGDRWLLSDPGCTETATLMIEKMPRMSDVTFSIWLARSHSCPVSYFEVKVQVEGQKEFNTLSVERKPS